MKRHLIIVVVSLLALGCSKQSNVSTDLQELDDLPSINIPSKTVDLSLLNYDNQTSIWTLDGERFSGYGVRYYEDGSLQEKFGVYNGKKQNEAEHWYPDGHLKHWAQYHQGKLHGVKKSWTPEAPHILIAHLQYRFGKAHGLQKKWYTSGEIFKILQLNMGREEGIQQAFRKNGDLFANYEAKDGRIYGLKKASLCYELENEKMLGIN